MNTSTIIELVGYAGSALVVVSMLMTSLRRLRIVNTAGSVIFAIYALIIRSYPTAAMQLCLIAINMIRLYKLSNTKKEYAVVRLRPGDSVLPYLASVHRKDIEQFFPGIFERIKAEEASGMEIFLVYNGSTAAGILMGRKDSGSGLDVSLDYTSPAYRDCSVGKFLYDYLAKEGIRRLCVKTDVPAHALYLRKMGFTQADGKFTKILAV